MIAQEEIKVLACTHPFNEQVFIVYHVINPAVGTIVNCNKGPVLVGYIFQLAEDRK